MSYFGKILFIKPSRILLYILLIFYVLCNPNSSYATHNRAGEIVYKQLNAYSFEITVYTYTSTLPGVADRPFLDVNLGDGTIKRVERVSEVYFPNNYKRNTYIVKHTYPGPGIYRILVEDPNRNYGVNNIPNSVYTVFSITTTLMVSGQVGENSTPVLLNPPIDRAALNHLFIHNPAAFDPDGDSLSYKLTPCTSEDGKPIPNYTYPEASYRFYVDSVSGDLVWDSPIDTGSYNVAIKISEWRKGIQIGNIIRDMQIDVFETNNNPPVIDSIPDFCVFAGDTIDIVITATDIDSDSINLMAMGGPFVVDDSQADPLAVIINQPGVVQSRFRWITSCKNIMSTPYQIVIKAEDNNSDISLVDMKTFTAKVMGPEPQNLVLSPSTNSITVEWNPPRCDNVIGYRIYRSDVLNSWLPDSCTIGMPSSSGFKLIGKTEGNTFFYDNNNGIGLPQGTDYCYMVTSVYPGNAEGKPTEVACTRLVNGTPVITNVSVIENQPNTGKIELKWRFPNGLDTLNMPGPFHYQIQRSNGIWDKNFYLIADNHDLNDTTYNDINVNTTDSTWCYRISLVHSPNNQLVGYPSEASTVEPYFSSTDRQLKVHFRANVPWINTIYKIYRRSQGENIFQQVAIVNQPLFIDDQVENNKPYEYYAIITGSYEFQGYQMETTNTTHTRTGFAHDDVPPCPPQLWVNVNCDSLYNIITWQKPDDPCGVDITGYIIYYSPLVDNLPDSLTYFTDDQPKEFIHRMFTSLGGHYGISSVDLSGNRSEMVTAIAADTCSVYMLPNVFSPNADGVNDIFHPLEYSHNFVERIHIRIFNRKGELVFESTDPFINWDGTYLGKGKVVPPGVYYYICDVFERRSVGIYQGPPLVGFIHIYTNVESVRLQE